MFDFLYAIQDGFDSQAHAVLQEFRVSSGTMSSGTVMIYRLKLAFSASSRIVVIHS